MKDSRMSVFREILGENWPWDIGIAHSTDKSLHVSNVLTLGSKELNGWQTFKCIAVIWLNSFTPRRSECDFKNAIFNLVLLIGIDRDSYNNVLKCLPWYLTDDKSTLVQVMAWCHQATSHHLKQCWLRSVSKYGVTRPQLYKDRAPE